MLANLQAIVLAAGQSIEFNTSKTKLLEKICGQELILYVTTLLERLDIPITVVIGYQKEEVYKTITDHHHKQIDFIVQEKQHGTGDALSCTRHAWQKKHILVMNGDVPLVTADIITTLYKKHQETNAAISFVIAHTNEPSSLSYGRIIQEENHMKVIEANKLNADLHEHCCINAGIYIVNKQFLEESITLLDRSEINPKSHITDLIKIASEKQYLITTISVPFDNVRGTNTMQELWAIEHIKRSELVKYWMEQGVRFTFPQSVHLDLDVTIGTDSIIGCGVHLLRGTRIGNACIIDPFCIIDNAIINDNATIYAHSVITNAAIGSKTYIGPFAHIRETSTIGNHSIIGNFVEVKKSSIGEYTKAKHLSYIGDAHVGMDVNIGAGTITCNHNGTTKQQTIIKNNAYIGSNTSLVAPVIINEGAYIGAGSVITKEVPADALAIARSQQINKLDYAKKIRKKAAVSAETTNNTPKEEAAKKINASRFFIGAKKLDHETII